MLIRETQHTLPLLMTGLALAFSAVLIVVAALKQTEAGTPSLQSCQAQASCEQSWIGLEPEKARRFASVFRS